MTRKNYTAIVDEIVTRENGATTPEHVWQALAAVFARDNHHFDPNRFFRYVDQRKESA